MPPKASSSSASRRKSGKPTPASSASTPNGTRNAIVTLKVASAKLRAIVNLAPVKKETPSSKGSPPPSNATPVTNVAENPSDPNTPAGPSTAAGAPATPAADEAKKKRVKRASPNGEVKPKGKPGPKKRARLDDGSVDPNAPKPVHRLGPKANQGAINAGLRALDRSGKPTRRWTKGTFKLKSFTGEVWELSRWHTQSKPKPEEPAKEESATVSASGSNHENKQPDSQSKSDGKPSSATDAEMKDASASMAAESPAAPTSASTPAPMPATASAPTAPVSVPTVVAAS